MEIKKFLADNIEQIKEFMKNHTAKEGAAHFSCGYPSFTLFLRKNNIKQKSFFQSLDFEEVKNFAKTHTVSECADYFTCSSATMYEYIHKYNLCYKKPKTSVAFALLKDNKVTKDFCNSHCISDIMNQYSITRNQTYKFIKKYNYKPLRSRYTRRNLQLEILKKLYKGESASDVSKALNVSLPYIYLVRSSYCLDISKEIIDKANLKRLEVEQTNHWEV